MSAAEWLAALRAEGITKVVEMDGWRTHNRNHKGPWGEVHGVAIHHTAGVGTGMPDYVYNGNAALPGPLCHDFLAKDGTLYLVGNGRTNHAGSIAANAHNAIAAETMPMSGIFKPDKTEPYDGNRELYGLEIENRGDGSDPYPDVQYDVAVRWAAARCRFHGWSAGSAAGHKEVTTRKIDPSFSMATFRIRVADRLKSKPTTAGGSTVADLTAKDVWAYKNVAQGETEDAYAYLRDTNADVARLQGQVAQQQTSINALMKLLQAVSAKVDAL
jgi:hypothetical protein